MSSAPTGWQNPRTNWQAADAPLPADFNRIEGNINAIEAGNRTLDPAQAPTGNSGTLRQILDWLANRIKAITGAANWWDAPATTLAAAKAHIDAAAPHPGHETPAGAQAKVDAHANRTDNPHQTTAAQVGAIAKGENNQSIQEVLALLSPTDTRSLVATAWTATNKPTTLQIKDGAAVVATINVTYNAEDRPTQIQVQVGGRTITYTITWTGDRFDGYTKTVV